MILCLVFKTLISRISNQSVICDAMKFTLVFTVVTMSYDRLGEDPGGLSHHRAVLQPGTEEELTLHGYRSSPCRAFFFHLLSVLTLGSLYLVTYWRPEWRVAWTTRKSALAEAESLILVVRLFAVKDIHCTIVCT